jgi:DNA polymerase-3 subunit alpha
MILRSESDEKIMEIVNMIQEKVGKENLYFEIIAQDESKDPNTAKINKKILELAKNNNIECIVDNAFQYINKEDKETWEMALAIKDGNKMYDQHRRKPT